MSTATLPAIEAARGEDLDAIVALLRASGLPEVGLAEHVGTAVVARQGDRIVGSAALELYEDGALLRSVAVDPDLRGRGLGERLVAAAVDLARRRGVARLYLLTETAAGFFPRFGFRPIGREAVGPGVRASVEFTSACPASAQAMRLDLADGARRGA